MLCGLAHKPYENVAVEDHILQFEVLLVLILVDEGSLEFTLLADIELLYLDLLRKVALPYDVQAMRKVQWQSKESSQLDEAYQTPKPMQSLCLLKYGVHCHHSNV